MSLPQHPPFSSSNGRTPTVPKEEERRKKEESKKGCIVGQLSLTPSTALIFEVRLKQNFVENLPRKNTTITTFHAVSKGGTGHFTDFPNFCYRDCFLVSCHSNLPEMNTTTRQEGLFTCTIAKRPGINTRMC
jgi:hypothetical protein